MHPMPYVGASIEVGRQGVHLASSQGIERRRMTYVVGQLHQGLGPHSPVEVVEEYHHGHRPQIEAPRVWRLRSVEQGIAWGCAQLKTTSPWKRR